MTIIRPVGGGDWIDRGKPAKADRPESRPPVTEKLRKAVTVKSNVTHAAPASSVTKRTKPAGSGRRKVHASNAERQKAYRARRKAKA